MELKSADKRRPAGEADIVLFIATFILAGIGIAMSYSASAVYALNTFGNSFYFLERQITWFCLGFIVLLVVQQIDYRVYIKYTKVMLIASLILLIMVLIPGVGKVVKGSTRWLGLGGLYFQPSEFVKIFMVIYLVKVFSSEGGIKMNMVFQLLIPIIIIALAFVLIMLQPDFGTAIDLLIASVLILFVSGFPLRYILSLSVISVPMFYLLIYQVDYRKDRILAFLDPWKERFGSGYHIIQSFIAFKAGGLLGVGLGFGTQKIKRLPEPHTDFIFAVIAEESGMFGTAFIVVLFCVILWRGARIAMTVSDDFGSLLAIGLSLVIVVQAFINIGVVAGILPITGIPLPFISYGGSSLISSMIIIGILLNISKYREREGMPFNFALGERVQG
ncbi:MAG: putative lipid II flippase FtsW [Spirochaetes bacterium]|nr:putative lipid II flippase FtsW [Spirochaetota bacterium]